MRTDGFLLWCCLIFGVLLTSGHAEPSVAPVKAPSATPTSLSMQTQLQGVEQELLKMNGQNQQSANSSVEKLPSVAPISSVQPISSEPAWTGAGMGQHLTSPASTAITAEQERERRSTAFKEVVNEALPMTPEQIRQLRVLYEKNQQASVISPEVPPTPVTTSQIVNLAPGTTPAVIRQAKGFVSSLVFVDSTGAPWPIQSYYLGNPTAFNIAWDGKSNTLMVQAMSNYTYGNLAVKLVDLDTPVTLTLVPSQRVVDYRVDLRVRGRGPSAKISSVTETLPNGADPALLGILDGIAPEGSKELKILGGDNEQAWVYKDHLFLRTSFTVLSPSWFATMASADGTKAYKMPLAPMILLSRDGKAIQLKVEGF